jgi:tRNA threonylcarbamoyladenosine biosynthesis protein TsaB
VALATAKGIALALGLPLAAVGTLEVEAYPYRDGVRPVCPVLDAGRGDLYAALFGPASAGWAQLWEEQAATPADIAARVPEGTLFCGEVPDWADRKSTRLNSSHNSESRMPSSA